MSVAAAAQEPKAARRLRGTALEPLPLGSIKPAGWLKDQLRIQADGLSGHLDEFWPDIKDSAWFGGKAEGWERVPYWLDGLVPLAYLLDDPELKAKVKRADRLHPRSPATRRLARTRRRQPEAQALRRLAAVPAVQGAHAIPASYGRSSDYPALLWCCRKIDQVISHEPLYSWAKVRAADLAITLYWLHDADRRALAPGSGEEIVCPEPRLARPVRELPLQGQGRRQERSGKPRRQYGHGPEVRRRAVPADRRREGQGRDLLDARILDRYHGQATGIFTCDEHLAGRSPSQGTELCTVVEAMYSLEVLAAIIGDPRLGDRLEMLAFNALPATFKKDMTAHQYDQQCNQVICTAAGEHVYVSNEADANLYGLEPNFGCCTANMHQGWPKFVSHLWMKTQRRRAGSDRLCAVRGRDHDRRASRCGLRSSPDSSYPFGDAGEAES